MALEGVFHGLDIASSALTAEMQRSEVVSANLSNMHTTRTPEGGPYRRRSVVFEELLASENSTLRGVSGGDDLASGVRVSRVYKDEETPFITRYDPGHADADEDGLVHLPNVEVFKEMVDMMVIERSFQANLAALRGYRQMLTDTVRNLNQ